MLSRVLNQLFIRVAMFKSASGNNGLSGPDNGGSSSNSNNGELFQQPPSTSNNGGSFLITINQF